ncbi:hypothetical protein PIB30_031214 [Stylosanthes scabra]|uniref:Uncharacterized protein n=1 Tax=Stylosanthes scabra TaxID=79078 RepID=A0ABU6TBJ3_9FABA|nr:hypothetical protein [Stylosanthes scabra]
MNYPLISLSPVGAAQPALSHHRHSFPTFLSSTASHTEPSSLTPEVSHSRPCLLHHRPNLNLTGSHSHSPSISLFRPHSGCRGLLSSPRPLASMSLQPSRPSRRASNIPTPCKIALMRMLTVQPDLITDKEYAQLLRPSTAN